MSKSTYYIKISSAYNSRFWEIAEQNEIIISETLMSGHYAKDESLYTAQLTKEEAVMLKMALPTAGFLNFNRLPRNTV